MGFSTAKAPCLSMLSSYFNIYFMLLIQVNMIVK